MLDTLTTICNPLPTDRSQIIKDRMVEEITSGLDIQEAASLLLQIHPTTTQCTRPLLPPLHVVKDKWLDLVSGLLIGCIMWGNDVLEEDHDTFLEAMVDDTMFLAEVGEDASRQGRTVPYVVELAQFITKLDAVEEVIDKAKAEWVACIDVLSRVLKRYSASMRLGPLQSYLLNCHNFDIEVAKLVAGLICFNAFSALNTSLVDHMDDLTRLYQTV